MDEYKAFLFFFVGISGSGKSTHAKKLAEEFEAAVINPDKIREELTGNISNQSRNGDVFKLANERMTNLLSNGKSVVFDATGLYREGRIETMKLAREAGAICYAVVFKDSLNPEVCNKRVLIDLKNNINRADTSDINIALRQHNQFLVEIMLITTEGWDCILYHQ